MSLFLLRRRDDFRLWFFVGSDESVILSLFDLQAVSFANKWKASGMIQGFLLQLA